MIKISDLNIEIFADSADLETILAAATNEFFIEGYTTNPSLMRQENVVDYEKFAKNILDSTEKPVSLEVFSDDFTEMKIQARKIDSWGENAYIKIPITNTKGNFSLKVIEDLSWEGIKLNITAIFTPEQVMAIEPLIDKDTPTIVSIFAGRIADTGRDPVPILEECGWILEKKPNCKLLWASCRELYNIIQADQAGCDIITVPLSILKKINLIDKNLEEYSKETVKQFHDDALIAGYKI